MMTESQHKSGVKTIKAILNNGVHLKRSTKILSYGTAIGIGTAGIQPIHVKKF